VTHTPEAEFEFRGGLADMILGAVVITLQDAGESIPESVDAAIDLALAELVFHNVENTEEDLKATVSFKKIVIV